MARLWSPGIEWRRLGGQPGGLYVNDRKSGTLRLHGCPRYCWVAALALGGVNEPAARVGYSFGYLRMAGDIWAETGTSV